MMGVWCGEMRGGGGLRGVGGVVMKVGRCD